jgi:4-amino-4-deoxy-L-arabinose transferase-like glycosyltransferase
MDDSLRSTELPVRNAWQTAIPFLTAERLSWAVIAFGVVLRAAQFLYNPALYVDEGALALNIISRTFAGLAQPLDSNQAAPLGFLALEKIALLALGDSEYSLRLFPFLFSVASLFLFYQVARRCLSSWAVPIALTFFAVSGHVIYYAAQIKQYSSDVAITILIALIGLEAASKELTARRTALLTIIGAAVVWFSHPSVFVLAGVGTTLAMAALRNKDWARFWKLSACCAVWVMSFAAFYIVSLRNLSGNQALENSWERKGTFMPLPPHSLSDIEWFFSAFFKMFSNPLGLPFPIAAGLVFVVGCVALLKKKTRLLILISPVLFTLLASGVHKYPFGRRLLLFLIPLLLIVIAAGIEYLINKQRRYSLLTGLVIIDLAMFELLAGDTLALSRKRLLFFIGFSLMMILAAVAAYVLNKRQRFAAVAATFVVALLLFQPVAGATNHMLHPRSRQDVRPIMAYVRDNRQPGDMIYVYHHQRESFQYYAPKYKLKEGEYVLGIDARDETKRRAHWDEYQRDLDQLRGNARVWILFSHVRKIQNIREDEFMLRYLNIIGVKIGEFIPREESSALESEEAEQADNDESPTAPASAYLYDLSKAPPVAPQPSRNFADGDP